MTIVVLVREWSVTLLRLSILKRVVIAAAQSGKIKTVLQAVALTGLCLPLRQVTMLRSTMPERCSSTPTRSSSPWRWR